MPTLAERAAEFLGKHKEYERALVVGARDCEAAALISDQAAEIQRLEAEVKAARARGVHESYEKAREQINRGRAVLAGEAILSLLEKPHD